MTTFYNTNPEVAAKEQAESGDYINWLRQVLGSCNINLLFGAGVNGAAFPNFSRFDDTKRVLKKNGFPGEGIEEELSKCDNDDIRLQVLEAFCNEFDKFASQLDFSNNSIVHLENLLVKISQLVGKAENRHPESKRINIFTLNYDRIVETVLGNKGLFHYELTSDRNGSMLPFEIVGYNSARREFIPTFAVYKLHGSADASNHLDKSRIVFPGEDKLGSVISLFYETLFAMKGELLRKNTVLFVIGYSWRDEHINGVIEDAIDNGALVFQVQYGEGNSVDKNLKDRVELIEPPADGLRQDSTLTLYDLLSKVMQS